VKNFVREKLTQQKAVCGIWSIIPSPTLAEIVALSKIDFQIFDMEHGNYDFGTLENSIRTSESLGCSPFVRIGGLDANATQKALDLGAHGIIYPQVHNHLDARVAVNYTKYPPLGQRGFNPFTRVQNYSLNQSQGTGKNSNDFSMTGVIIESKSAAKDLDRILDTDALEIFYLGAYDMSVALGCPGDMKNPELIKFMESSIKKIIDKKKIAGVMAQSPEAVEQYIQLGAQLIVMGVDSFLIGKSLSAVQEQFKKLI
jgi:2-keto-3-deoxy-L-rhamnonate aldolase RhmA